MVSPGLMKEFQRILGKDQVFLEEADRHTCGLEDATVPRGKIPAMIQALEEISRKFEVTIGTAKSRFPGKEFGEGARLYAKRIKAAVDPNHILNPGKIIGE
jgi:hypothetical protein